MMCINTSLFVVTLEIVIYHNSAAGRQEHSPTILHCMPVTGRPEFFVDWSHGNSHTRCLVPSSLLWNYDLAFILFPCGIICTLHLSVLSAESQSIVRQNTLQKLDFGSWSHMGNAISLVPEAIRGKFVVQFPKGDTLFASHTAKNVPFLFLFMSQVLPFYFSIFFLFLECRS